jgi:hypothetical protein
LLEGLGGFAARRHWVILIGWVIILGVVVGASHLWGGSNPPTVRTTWSDERRQATNLQTATALPTMSG